MALDIQTFRDHFLSLYQSAMDAGVRTQLPANAPTPGLDNPVVAAAAKVASIGATGAAIPQQAPPGYSSDAWNTARLVFQYMKAKVSGQEAAAAGIAADLKYGPDDVDWAEAVLQYVQYFGPGGARQQPEYLPPTATTPVLSFKPGAVVGILGDWGTGTTAAVTLAKQMAAFKPDVVIHLGDIYYSGMPDECSRNFADILNRIFDRKQVSIYNLTGNHDMYCGGVGYYGLLKTLNPPPLVPQPASFFCLRSTDDQWQFIAMDTGRFDYDPATVQTVLVTIGDAERAWLAGRIAEFRGSTILLSHHQLFSSFAQIGPAAADGTLTSFNPHLLDVFRTFTTAAATKNGRIAAWFWGHEHALGIYEPYFGLDKGRCVGHGAIPVLPGDGDKALFGTPKLLTAPLSLNGSVYAHGFVILRFAQDGTCVADYYNDDSGQKPFYSEPLGGAGALMS